MTFREFLEIKNAQAIVEHIETLSDDQARELIDQLDEQTLQTVELFMSEGFKKKLRRAESLAKQAKSVFKSEPVTSRFLGSAKARENTEKAVNAATAAELSAQTAQNRRIDRVRKKEGVRLGGTKTRYITSHPNMTPEQIATAKKEITTMDSPLSLSGRDDPNITPLEQTQAARERVKDFIAARSKVKPISDRRGSPLEAGRIGYEIPKPLSGADYMERDSWYNK